MGEGLKTWPIGLQYVDGFNPVDSRDINDCVPELIAGYNEWKAKMQERKILFMITSTARSFRVQVALYAQGRQVLSEVNLLRRIAGLRPISFKENSYCVTWTLASKHVINLEDRMATNDKSKAFDFAIIKDGVPTWQTKVDVDENSVPDYQEAGELAETTGLIWGGRFLPKPDLCHIQVAA